MGKFGEEIVTVLLAIVGVAILAVIVSKNSNTSSVLQAGGQAFSGSLGAALAPVDGSSGSLPGLPSIGGING